MNSLPYASPAKALIAFVAICLAASAALAQKPALKQTAAATAPAVADNAWLAKAAALYYSSAKAGLTGFDCSVHPDWHNLFVTADKGQAVSDDDPRIALLNTVKITMHARMKGNSVLDWATEATPSKPLDDTSTALLDGMHQSVQQTLEGFLQFWIPFMDRSVVPDSAEGLEISHTSAAHTIHAKQGGTDLTEVFSNELLLQQFNVELNGTSIKFSPAYKPTPQGLLVNGFVARILPAGTPPDKTQVMNVGIEYQSLGELVIPSQLHMEVVGTGTFDFAFDSCATNPK